MNYKKKVNEIVWNEVVWKERNDLPGHFNYRGMQGLMLEEALIKLIKKEKKKSYRA